MNSSTNKDFNVKNSLIESEWRENQNLDSLNYEVFKSLMERGEISEHCYYSKIAEYLELDYVDYSSMDLIPELFEIISIEIAKRYKIFPLKKNGIVVTVATCDPEDIKLLHQLEVITKHQIKFVVAIKNDIENCISYAESKIDQLTGATEDFLLINEQGESEKLLEDSIDDHSGPIVSFINTIIKTALNRRSSDIHIECFEHSVKVKYRIDGQLFSATEAIDVKHHGALVSRLKVMAELDIAEKRVPQDGRFKLSYGKREIDFRISVLPAVYGENVVIRILDTKGVNRGIDQTSLQSIGLTTSQLQEFRRLVTEPYGLILITGPTGSGKTTTLYSALQETFMGDEKVITIEDPVEYQLDGITQIAVNNKKGLTFAKGLRSILRHDPDKILIGEIRDAETADIAIQSALTGHLVLSSVHANNALDVMARLHNMGAVLSDAISALNGVLAQRLVRVLCDRCKQPKYYIEDEISNFLEINQLSNVTTYSAQGCQACDNTGYIGRTVVSELLLIDEKLRTKILLGDTSIVLSETATYVNNETMREVAIRKYCEGITTFEEVNRVTFAK